MGRLRRGLGEVETPHLVRRFDASFSVLCDLMFSLACVYITMPKFRQKIFPFLPTHDHNIFTYQCDLHAPFGPQEGS